MHNQPLLEHIDILVKLLHHDDMLISEKAGRCLEILPKLYIMGALKNSNANVYEMILTPVNISMLATALEIGSPTIKKQILSCLKDLLANHPKLVTPLVISSDLMKTIRGFAKGGKGGKTFTSLAADIVSMIGWKTL